MSSADNVVGSHVAMERKASMMTKPDNPTEENSHDLRDNRISASAVGNPMRRSTKIVKDET